MKNTLILILLLLSINSYGQKITVKGVAIDFADYESRVWVSVKDSHSKKAASDSLLTNGGLESINEKKSIVYADEKGNFEIEAKLTDSLVFSSILHVSETYLVSDLLKRDNIRIELKPKVCVEYIGCKEVPKNLYAFIGKKIKVEYVEEVYYCNIAQMDAKYEAEYQILENVYGNFPNDTINFVSYDHSSIRRYDYYENVLIYIANFCDNLTHLKYQYHDVYETIDGKWASPYDYRDYKKIDSTYHIKPQKIEFKNPILFEIEDKNLDRIKAKYPKPYYEIRSGKVIMLYGNYPNELFELKKLTFFLNNFVSFIKLFRIYKLYK